MKGNPFSDHLDSAFCRHVLALDTYPPNALLESALEGPPSNSNVFAVFQKVTNEIGPRGCGIKPHRGQGIFIREDWFPRVPDCVSLSFSPPPPSPLSLSLIHTHTHTHACTLTFLPSTSDFPGLFRGNRQRPIYVRAMQCPSVSLSLYLFSYLAYCGAETPVEICI